MRPRNHSRKGQTILLMTVFIGFLFGMSALAFDIGFAMLVRAKLVSAVDAATMAAIRFVPQGVGPMQNAAQRTFQANLPAGLLLTKNPTITTPVLTPVNGAIEVRVTGSAEVPMFFARIFGKESLTVNAGTTTARRDRNIMLVLDYSGSVGPVLGNIKTAAKAFVNSFSDQYDNVGLAVFSRSASLYYAPQKPFTTDLNTTIDSIQQGNLTNHASGLYYAYQALLDLNDPIKNLKNNEIVFFTDGRANHFPAQFNITGAANCPGALLDTSVNPPVRYINGVYGINSGTVWSTVAPPPTIPNGNPPTTPDCAGWNNSWRQSIRPTWFPPNSLNGTVIAPLGVPLAGFKNASPPLTTLNNARREEISANVLDNLARIVRKDATLNARIHTIGYQGTGAILTDVMQRVANCDGCPNVAAADAADPTQKKGRFVAATTADELLTAFLDVAGFIGRITK